MIGPKRIICLTEETTELFYLLGIEERIVGISAYTVRPLRAKKEKPKISAFINGNIKRIKELKPDLVIGFSDIQSGLAKNLIAEGLNVLVTNQRTILEIFDTLSLLGSIVGKGNETQKLIEGWKRKLDEIERVYSSKSQPSVFFQEWDEPIITGISWVSELIKLAGGKDCFEHLKTKSLAKDRIISAIDVAKANPEVYIGSWCGKPMNFEWVQKHPDWQNVNAILNHKVYELDPSIILQPGPALFEEGIDQLVKLIHS
ncbi:cobalamin-binding protein [Leptospira interrogans]|uniref:cobalamin-binding protein n=1 Tax=Leptospira interrogans TaxID=173 RepID=UPI000345B5A6|nr:cobalamin-binding protein [Leptospira interrogans]KAA1268750.1 cobalamin-binding protein [Leptospira interrogans serovar Weerasinghe]KAA1290798.1 cobalamin-binding protein [Leptospira interrogans serovar Geyaweera]QCO38865.1 cobalamin-binding protein [Leptospira interrogans]QCO42607.1 cobalamin-binding protein [Leptospira interrogans]ULG81319.1 cobalamin-binding protein [Leptospira interrogans]